MATSTGAAEAGKQPLRCLDEDPEIRRQKFVCMSFLTPSDVDVRDRGYFEARAFALANPGETFADAAAYDAALTDWCAQRQTDLDEEFQAATDGKPHIPIVKVRGSYKTYAEAAERCRDLNKVDQVVDIFVAQVGRWVPCDGKRREDETEVNYAEEQMQQLMSKRKENQELARQEVERRRQEAVTHSVMQQKNVTTAAAAATE
jgi:hypothetical protein